VEEQDVGKIVCFRMNAVPIALISVAMSGLVITVGALAKESIPPINEEQENIPKIVDQI